MFKFFFFTIFIFLSSPIFGEKAPDQNKETSKADAQINKNEASAATMDIKQTSNESTAYHKDLLKNYNKTIHLEWLGGLGMTNSVAFFLPLTLEAQALILNHHNGELRWLFQVGGILLSTLKLEMNVFPLLQTGLKYHFSKKFYGSLKGGLIGVKPGDRMWTGGILIGTQIETVTIEGGIQFFYPDEDYYDHGIIFNMVSPIKLW